MKKSENLKKLLLGIFIILLLAAAFLGFINIKGPDNIFPCRTWFGKPKYTGLAPAVYEFGDENFQTVDIITCILNDSKTQSQEPGVLEIGFFDKTWRMHRYTARLGGEKQSRVGFCFTNLEEGKRSCHIAELEDILEKFKRGDIVRLSIVYKDKDLIFLSEDEQGGGYKTFVNNLKEALERKNGFPEVNNYILEISQVDI